MYWQCLHILALREYSLNGRRKLLPVIEGDPIFCDSVAHLHAVFFHLHRTITQAIFIPKNSRFSCCLPIFVVPAYLKRKMMSF